LSGDDETIRFPYRKITKQEHAVYSTICPVHCLVKDYKDSPIPLRVLEVASLADEYFKELYVMYPEVYEKDPILIGCTTGWYGDKYILARWGEELDEFPFLLKKAMGIWREKVSRKLIEMKYELDRAIELCKATGPSMASFNTQSLPSLYVN